MFSFDMEGKGNRFLISFTAILLFVFSSCHYGRVPNAPDWILKAPIGQGFIYAVGNSGNTLYHSDARRRAADDARKELAKSLEVKISSITLIFTNADSRNIYNETFLVEATSQAVNTVAQNSRIIEYWVDSRGLVPGMEPNTVYALATMRAHEVVGKLSDTAKRVLTEDQSTEVIERTKEIFGLGQKN